MFSKDRVLYSLLVAGALAVVALSVVGVVQIIDYAPNETALPASAGYRLCNGCGIVESVHRDIAPKTTLAAAGDTAISPARYRVRVRMSDGSAQTVYRNEAPELDVGDEIKVVNGAIFALE